MGVPVTKGRSRAAKSAAFWVNAVAQKDKNNSPTTGVASSLAVGRRLNVLIVFHTSALILRQYVIVGSTVPDPDLTRTNVRNID